MNYLFILPILLVSWLLVKYLQPLTHRLSISYPSLLMVLGFVGSELVISQGYDTGLRWDSFSNIVNYFILPLMVYDIAFRLSAEDFLKRLTPIIVLSVPFYIISVLIGATILVAWIDHPGFPFIAGIITAAMLASTSLNSFRREKETPHGVVSILKGEGLFNSVGLIVVITLTLEIINHNVSYEQFSFFSAYVLFIKLFTGGVFIGLIGGAIGWYLISKTSNKSANALISVIIAFATFYVSSIYFQVSGIIAILVAGLMLNAQMQSQNQTTKRFLNDFWSLNANLTRTLLYIMLGISIYLPFLQNQWLAIIIGVVATLVARLLLIYLGFGLLAKYSKQFNMPPLEKFALFLGNIKGAAVIALVLSLPESLPYSHTIQSIVYGMVIFSLLVQAPILKILLPKMAIKKSIETK